MTDWLVKTDLPFHVIRDHSLHGAVIPAGTWGVRWDCIVNPIYLKLTLEFNLIRRSSVYYSDMIEKAMTKMFKDVSNCFVTILLTLLLTLDREL